MHFAVIDVGSPAKGNLGWWVLGPETDKGGTDTVSMFETLTGVAGVGRSSWDLKLRCMFRQSGRH